MYLRVPANVNYKSKIRLRSPLRFFIFEFMLYLVAWLYIPKATFSIKLFRIAATHIESFKNVYYKCGGSLVAQHNNWVQCAHLFSEMILFCYFSSYLRRVLSENNKEINTQEWKHSKRVIYVKGLVV